MKFSSTILHRHSPPAIPNSAATAYGLVKLNLAQAAFNAEMPCAAAELPISFARSAGQLPGTVSGWLAGVCVPMLGLSASPEEALLCKVLSVAAGVNC